MDMHGENRGEKRDKPFAKTPATEAHDMTSSGDSPNKHDAEGSGTDKPKTDKPKTQDQSRRDRSADAISNGLRKLWQDVALEPVPDDFLSLLDKIESGASTPASGTADPASDTADGSTTSAGKKA